MKIFGFEFKSRKQKIKELIVEDLIEHKDVAHAAVMYQNTNMDPIRLESYTYYEDAVTYVKRVAAENKLYIPRYNAWFWDKDHFKFAKGMVNW